MNKFMIMWRKNRLKVLIKMNIKGQISDEEYKKEVQKLTDEIYLLENIDKR